MLPYPLINFEIQKYYQNAPRFNDAYSKSNLSKIKNGVSVTNFDEYKLIGTHWIDLYEYTNLFCPNEYEKNNKIILK